MLRNTETDEFPNNEFATIQEGAVSELFLPLDCLDLDLTLQSKKDFEEIDALLLKYEIPEKTTINLTNATKIAAQSWLGRPLMHLNGTKVLAAEDIYHLKNKYYTAQGERVFTEMVLRG